MFKEIVTKAVVGKGKKYFKNSYNLLVDNNVNTILGCWVINHEFKGSVKDDKVSIDGKCDINIWYSYDDDKKTGVATKTVSYSELVSVKTKNDTSLAGSDIIVRVLKQPTCTNVTAKDDVIDFDIEKILDSIELNPYELIFFKKIMEDALINIKNNKNPSDLEIVPNIVKSLQNVNDRLNDLGDLSELTDLNVLDAYDYHDELSYNDYETGINDLDKLYESNEKITEEELENMFQKLEIKEIEEFDNIFEHIETYNIETIMDISNKVKNEKINNAFKEFEDFVSPLNSLCYKKDILSEKELKLLCILLKDAILNYEEHDNFKASLFNLMDSYMEELEKKKEISEKTVVDQNIKEKSSSSSKRNSFFESIRVSPEELANNKKITIKKENVENDCHNLDR